MIYVRYIDRMRYIQNLGPRSLKISLQFPYPKTTFHIVHSYSLQQVNRAGPGIVYVDEEVLKFATLETGP